MKKMSRILMLAAGMSLFAIASSNAQEIIVRTRPFRPRTVVVARPFRPSPHHVWVGEEWTPGGGNYVYHDGYWAVPPHPGAVWVAGHWRRRPGGYVWVPGRWNR
ncbi:MAG: hypothetical protein JWP45_3427 [Mucilaginibacter sp.]|nr:hypothetical protein [Mucilaginibacter sp.]